VTAGEHTPRALAAAAERGAVPPGEAERFAGYGVMGLPFASGHVLAARRFPASSIGPGYTSVWHRSPDGDWTFWQDQPDDQSCPRYFSAAVSTSCRVDIDLSWPTDATLRIVIPEVGLEWTAQMSSTPVTRMLNAVGRIMPDRAWRARTVLTAMGAVAGRALRAGKVAMIGTAPNGHDFIANPLRIWLIEESTARLGVDDFGPVGPLGEQTHLGDFWLPQRGIFAIGRAYFEAADHVDVGP
jgi:hypothetical protein